MIGGEPEIMHTLAAESFTCGAGDPMGARTCLGGHLLRQCTGTMLGVSHYRLFRAVPTRLLVVLGRVCCELRETELPPLVIGLPSAIYIANDDIHEFSMSPLALELFPLEERRDMRYESDRNELRARVWNEFVRRAGYTEDAE